MGFWAMWKQYLEERSVLKAMRRLGSGDIIYNQAEGIMALKSGKHSAELVVKPVSDEEDPYKFWLELSGASFLSDKKVLRAIWRTCWKETAISAGTFPGQNEPLTFSQVEARVRPLTFTAVVYHTIEV